MIYTWIKLIVFSWGWRSDAKVNISENENLTVNDYQRMKTLLIKYARTNFVLALQALFFYVSLKFW